MAKKLSELSDAEFMLYQAYLIRVMKEEIMHTMSKLIEMPKDISDNILANHRWNIDDMKLMRVVCERHFPELNHKPDAIEAKIKEWTG